MYRRKTRIRPLLVEEKDEFQELTEYLEERTRRNAPYLKILTGTELPDTFLALMWSRDFWRDKYFKLKEGRKA